MLLTAICNWRSPAILKNRQTSPFETKTFLKVMQLTSVIFLAFSLSLSANTISQTVSLSGKNLPVQQVIAEIYQQTGYSVLARTDALKRIGNLTIEAKDMALEQFVSLMLKGKPYVFEVDAKTIFIKSKTPTTKSKSVPLLNIEAPPITGRIVDSTGNPLAGATIAVKEKNRSTTTNSDGVFTLDVSEGDVLQISFVGYAAREIRIVQQMLADGNVGLVRLFFTAASMEEVAVEANTGYQRIKPNEINGSVVVIDNKTLNQQVGTNILNRLEGVTPGVSFNRGYSNGNLQNKTNISVRGLGTIHGPLDPLIVLDNFIYEGNIENINPNDIESITILKDASAASIWGARAGNGVIVITTKKGAFRKKTTVELNTNFILTEKPDLTPLNELNSSDYIDIEQFLFDEGFFDPIINQQFQALTPAVNIFLKKRNGLISEMDAAHQISELAKISSKEQFTRDFFRNGITQQYALNITGGTENIKWLVAGNYDKSVDNLDANYDKKNFRFSNVFKAAKNLEIDLNVYYTSRKSISGKYDFNSVNSINGRYVPYLKFSNEDGTALPIDKYYRVDYIDTVGDGRMLDWKYYPLDDYKHNRSTTELEDILATVGLNYRIIDPLQLTIQYQHQRQNSRTEGLSNELSYDTRDVINSFSQIDWNSSSVNYIVPRGSILNLSNRTVKSQNIRGQLNFNKAWNKHYISTIAGGEIREAIGKGEGSRFYGYKTDPLNFSNVDFVNLYPTLPTGNWQRIPGAAVPSLAINRFISVYSNFSYSYQHRYSISLSARKDGSNLLGVNTNDKWKPLWSTGLGWVISKERFYTLKSLSYLKFRITYGKSGNLDLSKTALPIAYFANNTTTNLPAAYIYQINNPELRWEEVSQLNIGFDFSGFNNRITGSVDYYIKKGSDLYGRTPYDYTTWGRVSDITKNVANMKGKGIDLNLNVRLIDRSIKWQSSLLYNYNNNKTSAYYEKSSINLFTLLGNGRSITPVIGKPLYSIAAYKWGGLDASGNPQGYLNGELSTNYLDIFNDALIKGMEGDNIIYIGSALPTSFGSFINSFSWKGIELAVNISYKAGYYFMKPSLSYNGLVNNGTGNQEYLDRWQSPGDEHTTNVPSFKYPLDSRRDMFYAQSEINVLKGNHIRLGYINLSYSILKMQHGFEQCSIYFNAANLGILWRANKLGIDPDYPGSIHPQKMFTVGVRARF